MPRAVLVAAVLATCGCSKPEVAPPPRAVETIVVRDAGEALATTYSGQVVSAYSAQHAFRVSGMIVQRLVEVGDTVSLGQVLARLDPKDLDVNVRDTAAQLAAARAQAQSLSTDLARARGLAAEGFISQAELDRAQADADSANARVTSASAQQSGAGQQRSYAVLKAERAGVVTAVKGDPGEVVAQGQSVVTVDEPGRLEVAVSIPEGEVARFRSGTLGVRLWTDPGRVIPARIRTLSGAANAQTRTFDARVAFDDEARRAAIGISAEVVLSQAPAAKLVRVPLSAVVRNDGRPTVWTVAGDPVKATPHAVTVQGVQGNASLISSGLAPGDRIVTAGAHLLKPDQVVRAIPSSSEAER